LLALALALIAPMSVVSPASAATGGPVAVPIESRPYNDGPRAPRRQAGTVDGTGVRMYDFAPITGGHAYNHPVLQAQYGLQLLNSYRHTHDGWYLNLAARQGQRIVDTHIESRGAWWFPYPFDFPLSSGIGFTMEAPWYSAMAEGQALSLFVRLADVTGQQRWRDAADGAFAALRLDYSGSVPWGTWRDGNDMLWLEEYPGHTMSTSSRVLNGHLFAIYGVWEYWRQTQSSVAAALFRDAVRTVRRYVLRGFRNPGWASSYGLRGDVPSDRYHAIHVNQLLHLHALTGDPVFATMAETLHDDFSVPAQVTRIEFTAGRHTGVQFTSPAEGEVVSRRTIRLNDASMAPVDQRRRIWGQRGYWYRVTAGSLTGRWVQEVPLIRATPGPVAAVSYFADRTVVIPKGGYSGYTATRHRTITLRHTSTAPVSQIGWINGRSAVAVAAGTLRGYWLPLYPGLSLR
jgi:hypothetical protein